MSQRRIKIYNKTLRKININQWRKWVKKYCDYPPLTINIINWEKEDNLINIKGGFLLEEIYVIVSSCDSIEDINSTFLHELAHWIVYHKENLNHYLKAADKDLYEFLTSNRFSKKKLNSRYFQDTLCYEEVFADMFAIMVISLEKGKK